MSSFSAILSSLQDGRSKENSNKPTGTGQVIVPQSRPSSTAQRPTVSAPVGVKRKRDDEGVEHRKAVKLSADTHRQQPRPQSISSRPTQAQKSQPPVESTPISNGTMRTKTSTTATTRIVPNAQSVSTPQQPQTASTKPPAKRGFASLMAKAKEAQDAIKAAGPDVIKHKPTEIMKKKERERLKHEAKERQKQERRLGAAYAGTMKSGSTLKAQTLQKPKPVMPAYAGTMRAKSATSLKHKAQPKGLGKDKYGGYASWSDLSGDEDEDANNYDSESDMEEAGFDDMMEEEMHAERLAKREDLKEQEEEERRRKEKLERKKKLMALSSSAAAAKKRY